MVQFAEGLDAAIQLFGLQLIESIDGPLQKVCVYRHPHFGRVLTIGDELHHVEAWQELYHEPLVHLPASFIPKVTSALVLGGGCLFAAKEALKYRSIEHLDLIEHDPNVLDMMSRHYDHADQVLHDPRLHVRISDARHVCSSLKRKYDLIISDCIDFSSEYDGVTPMYVRLQELLTTDGVCSEVMYRSIFETEVVQRVQRSLQLCSNVRYGLITIPEYPGILHVHVLWGVNGRLGKADRLVTNLEQRRHLKDGSLSLRYFDPRHRAFFLYMPPYALEKLKSDAVT